MEDLTGLVLAVVAWCAGRFLVPKAKTPEVKDNAQEMFELLKGEVA